jgi:hypothetical protein
MKLNESAKKSLRVSAYKIVSIKFIICNISRNFKKKLERINSWQKTFWLCGGGLEIRN